MADIDAQSVFFDNFPSQLDRDSILNMFQRYATQGKILSFIVMPTATNQYGMVTFQHAGDAKACSRGLNGLHFSYWSDSKNFRTYILHITLSGPTDPYGYSEYFTPFWGTSNPYGREPLPSGKDSSSSEELHEFSPTSSYGSRRGSSSLLGGSSFGRHHDFVEF